MFDFLFKNRKQGQGIWKYADFYTEKIVEQDRLVLCDGDTPLEENAELDKLLGIEHLYFKREDRNQTGSLKGRSLCYQVAVNRQRRARALVISTSGNAGIAAAAYARQAGMTLFVFISPDTERGKVADMQQYGPVIIKSKRAIRLSNYVAAKYRIPNLRPSVDDDSLEGFKSLALEIVDQAGPVDAVFTFVTSGSSFVGMYRGFAAYLKQHKTEKIPRLYAVQSGEIFSVAEEFEENAELLRALQSRAAGEIGAGQLGVKHTARKQEILEIIRSTGGGAVYVSAGEIEQARKTLLAKDLETSLEGCASYAALVKTQPREKFQKAVCIFSGKLRGREAEADESTIYSAENFEEVDRIVGSRLLP